MSNAPAAPLLGARALGCRRGRRMLFCGVDLALPPGRLAWLRGSNGSGKTSLLRILAGLAPAAEGGVFWRGALLQDAGAAARRGVLYVGHANALKDDLTLAEAVAFHARLAGLDAADSRTVRALEMLGLARWRDAPVRTLSQGQRRRGAMSRLALDDAPRVWLLDEPYDALDSPSSALLSALIVAHAERGGAALLTSHQPVDLPAVHSVDLEPWRVQ